MTFLNTWRKMKRIKILIACEYSGTIREAFAKKGFETWSCDITDTDLPGKHITGDVRKVLKENWHLMIGHPPCTYLSFAAKKYWINPGRARKRIEALNFFLDLWEAPIEHICLENPLGIIDQVIEKHSQIIHPYYFGDSELKRTCLWLKNLPKLQFNLTDDLFYSRSSVDKPNPIYTDISGKKRYFVDANRGYQGEGNSFKIRSRSFPSIAEAMAEQWGNFLIHKYREHGERV